jgi:hypothetical protein
VDGHRRYAEDPDPKWYSGPAPYESGVHERRPDDEYRAPEQRSGDEPRYPLTGGVDSLAPADDYVPGSYAGPYRPAGAFAVDDPLTSGSFTRGAPADEPPVASSARPALDAIRMPLRPTEYPAVRPGSATPPSAGPLGAGPLGAGPADAAAADPTTTIGGYGTPAAPFAAAPTFPPAEKPSGQTYPSAQAGPGYNEPTSFVPPLGVRTVDGPAADVAAVVAGAGRSSDDGVYRTRRPVSAVVFAIVTAALMVPVLRLLFDVALADRPAAGAIVPAVLLTLGLPLTGLGLYGVAGAGRTPGRNAWLSAPAGYLPVGLVLLLAAALATA